MERKPIPQDHIAEAAYYNAERRGFVEGSDVDDWLQAEEELKRVQDREIEGSAPREVIAPEHVEMRASEFGVTPEQLRVAIQHAGPAVDDVRSYLSR